MQPVLGLLLIKTNTLSAHYRSVKAVVQAVRNGYTGKFGSSGAEPRRGGREEVVPRR